MGEKKNNEKKGNDTITALFKVDMHCNGCVKKILETVKHFKGVEDVKGDSENNKLTVTGKVDPVKLREKLEVKTKKKVELISPKPKKDGNGEAADNKKKQETPSVQTVVLKIRLHCEGCIQKIRKTIFEIKGVEGVKVDLEKDLVTVNGTIDAKTLLSVLKKKLKNKDIDIVQPKKDGEKKKDGEDKKKDGGEKKESQEGVKAESSKREYGGFGSDPGAGYGYGYGYTVHYVPVHHPAPQMFSDENPNACSIM